MNGLRVFRLTIAYDGTEFHGWQRQPELRTVQGELESALALVLGQGGISVNGAGRTDAGVHARGQVGSFRAETVMPGHAFAPMLNRVLPRDVRVVESAEAGPEFHARHSARSRRYVYRLLDADDVLLRRHAWFPGRTLEQSALAAAATPLLGAHDYSAFEAKGSTEVDPNCRVSRAHFSRWEGGLAFEVQADHFLYHMVRNLMGTLLFAARQRDPQAHVAAVLASRERSRAANTAPAQGLCLEHVGYEEEGAAS